MKRYIFAFALVGCASLPAERPPCDATSLGVLTAQCVVRVRACEPSPAPCPAEDECIAELDARQSLCLARGAE